VSLATVTPSELATWSKYIHEISGIHLDQTKAYLLETRLDSLMQEARCSTFSELFFRVQSDLTHKFRDKVIDAITTNETSFFRDNSPFDLLRHKLIPELMDRRNRTGRRAPIRIWSAACSTGQEAYSTGIVFKELLGNLSSYDIRILGTDISHQAVARASYGQYSRMELERGMPQEKVARFFTPAGEQWKICDEIRALATFRTINLLEPFAFPEPFDLIFCRNIAIYFTEPDKLRLFRNIGKCLAKDGSLIIGSTESITGLCPEFESKRHMRSVFYAWRENGGRSPGARPELGR
jgi:chemotaxis protein methyltransferase CheR